LLFVCISISICGFEYVCIFEVYSAAGPLSKPVAQ
jgi:hypothetical protein